VLFDDSCNWHVLFLIPLSHSVRSKTDACQGGKRSHLPHAGLAAVAALAPVPPTPVAFRGQGTRAVAVVVAVEGHGADSTKRSVTQSIADRASCFFALPLAVVSDDLPCGDASKSACRGAAFAVGTAIALPRVSLLVHIHGVVVAVICAFSVAVSVLALVKVSLFSAAAAVYFFDSTLVVVVFVNARAGNLSVLVNLCTLNKLIGRLLDSLADDDGLRHLLPDDNGLLGRLGFVADDDGLGQWLGSWFRAKELGGAGVPLELIRLVVPLLLLRVALPLVFARDADLSGAGAGRRRRAVDLALDAVLADLTARRRRRAVGIAVFADLTHFAASWWRVVALHHVLFSHLPALFIVVARAVDQAHLLLVSILG
jgi:hypothetical protein